MYSTLPFRRMGNSLRASLLRDCSRKQTLHFMSSTRANCSTLDKLTRSLSSADTPVDFEVKELEGDIPGV